MPDSVSFDRILYWEPAALELAEDITQVFDAEESPFVKSSASDELFREMRRYARRRTNLENKSVDWVRPKVFGRSILISGVRGSGKTATVFWVLRELQDQLLREGHPPVVYTQLDQSCGPKASQAVAKSVILRRPIQRGCGPGGVSLARLL